MMLCFELQPNNNPHFHLSFICCAFICAAGGFLYTFKVVFQGPVYKVVFQRTGLGLSIRSSSSTKVLCIKLISFVTKSKIEV